MARSLVHWLAWYVRLGMTHKTADAAWAKAQFRWNQEPPICMQFIFDVQEVGYDAVRTPEGWSIQKVKT